MPGFMEVVKKAWIEPLEHVEPYQVLFHKLKKVALRLSEWSRGLFSKAKVHLHAALLVILRLDIAQETHNSPPRRVTLGRGLKGGSLAWPCLRELAKSKV